MNKKDLIKEIVQKNPNLSATEIGKLVNLSRITVNWHLRTLGVYRDRNTIRKLNNTNRSFEIPINNNAEQIILGSILGDGSMAKWNRHEDSKRNLNSRLTFMHSLKQKEYVLYKISLLEKFGIKCNKVIIDTNKYNIHINGREITENGRISCSTRRCISFNKYRDLFYKEKKYVNRYIYKLNSLGLAIWYMDDGSKSKNSYIFYTDGFSKKGIILLQKMLKHNFNIDTTTYKHGKGGFIIRVRNKSREHFVSLIKPYICKSMKYKV